MSQSIVLVSNTEPRCRCSPLIILVIYLLHLFPVSVNHCSGRNIEYILLREQEFPIYKWIYAFLSVWAQSTCPWRANRLSKCFLGSLFLLVLFLDFSFSFQTSSSINYFIFFVQMQFYQLLNLA